MTLVPPLRVVPSKVAGVISVSETFSKVVLSDGRQTERNDVFVSALTSPVNTVESREGIFVGTYVRSWDVCAQVC